MKADVFRTGLMMMLCVAATLCTGQTGGDSYQTSVTATNASGDKIISFFDVNDAEIRSVFRQLSTYSGVDIVICDNVNGKVSISVRNKTWREILSIICKVNNLAAIREENYIYVMTDEDYRNRQVQNATMDQMTEDVSPLSREVIRVAHTPADEMAKAISNLLSKRGKVTVVEHTNALIIYDTEENLTQIRKMIGELDIETQQISISCKIIEVSSGVMQNFGIHWGYFSKADKLEVSHLPEKNFVTGALEKISYGIISPDKLSVALEYLFSDGKGQVVAQPQITTLDNKEAQIFMGSQIPLTYLDVAGNTNVKMINAGTELVVTPHISGEGRIMLNLKPKKESYQLQQGLPIIDEQSAITNVVVNNGETVVIAGLTSNETRNDESGIPVLKDIPLIGNLFKRTQKKVDKRDLIIFVTPHIVDSQMMSIPANDSSSTQQGLSGSD